MNLATAVEFQGEIARLQAVIESGDHCPYVTGSVTRYCTLTPFTLTDAERGAIEAAIAYMAPVDNYNTTARDTLRGLLRRTRATDGR